MLIYIPYKIEALLSPYRNLLTLSLAPMASYKMWPVHKVKNINFSCARCGRKSWRENTGDACTHLSLPNLVCARINALIRLIVINLVVILRSIWARYSSSGCIYAVAYKFGVGAGISRVFAVLMMRQNDLPPIYNWCARATFYRTLLSVQGIGLI
jgi:hypothetical protein